MSRSARSPISCAHQSSAKTFFRIHLTRLQPLHSAQYMKSLMNFAAKKGVEWGDMVKVATIDSMQDEIQCIPILLHLYCQPSLATRLKASQGIGKIEGLAKKAANGV